MASQAFIPGRTNVVNTCTKISFGFTDSDMGFTCIARCNFGLKTCVFKSNFAIFYLGNERRINGRIDSSTTSLGSALNFDSDWNLMNCSLVCLIGINTNHAITDIRCYRKLTCVNGFSTFNGQSKGIIFYPIASLSSVGLIGSCAECKLTVFCIEA